MCWRSAVSSRPPGMHQVKCWLQSGAACRGRCGRILFGCFRFSPQWPGEGSDRTILGPPSAQAGSGISQGRSFAPPVRNWQLPCQRAPLSPRRSRTSSVSCRGAACGADLKKHDGGADADHGAGRKRLRAFAGKAAETDLPEPEPPSIAVCRGYFDRNSDRMEHVRPLRCFSTPYDGLLPLGKHHYSDDFRSSSSASGQVLCRP
jgi:hypothetical protein